MVGSLHCLISIAKVYSSSWAFVLLVLDKCVSSDSVYSSGDLGLYTWLDLTLVRLCRGRLGSPSSVRCNCRRLLDIHTWRGR